MLVELFLPAIVVTLLDQASKELIVRRAPGRPASPAGLRPRLRVVSNGRPGLGLVQHRTAAVVLLGLAVLSSLPLVHVLSALSSSHGLMAWSAALGGAASNLLDMLRRGAVVDFIDLRVWPVFNLADAAIVSGLAVVIWTVARAHA